MVIPSLFYYVFTCLLWRVVSSADTCERLEAKLEYRQEEAPRDLSGVLPVVVERFNKALQGVVDVHVEWTGADLHGRVGEHIVECTVTRLASEIPGGGADEGFTDESGRRVVAQCFQVPFTILDTDECKLPRDHLMGQQCDDSAICINTIGSYECVCPRVDELVNPSGTADDNLWTTLAAQDRSPWEVSYNETSRSSCPSMSSTNGCCPERADIKGGSKCRKSFKCPSDPCISKSSNQCAPSAVCTRKLTPAEDPNYYCRCPSGLMGNGRKCRLGVDKTPQPKVMFDGVTPTEETVKNNYYCDCTEPIVDACSGFPPCKGKHEVCTVTDGNVPKCMCKPGFVLHEKYGCVDSSPPILRLNHDPNGDRILRLKQGDQYKEYAVHIQDENAEEYLRSLKIAYSQPLPHGCLTRIGEFHVNYTIATPWTDPPYVRITRDVVIEDIDECKTGIAKRLERSCPQLLPKCDTEAGATCVNTIGSYTCKCPKFTVGDGFLSGLSFDAMETPVGFQEGTGCHDTSKPVIKLAGPNPKVFRVCECGGIKGVMGKKKSDADLQDRQQRLYGNDIKDLIAATAGAELCATYSNTKPVPSDCVNAYDETYKGRVDLSGEVSVGEPIQKTPHRWQVPYDVKDAAGNAAATVYRDVEVEEVDLDVVESKVRKEMQKENEAAIDAAVSRALVEDRKKRGSKNNQAQLCPKCPKCDCSGDFDVSMCESVCNNARAETCSVDNDDQSVVIQLLLQLEKLFPPSLAPSILIITLLMFVFLLFRGLGSLLFTPVDSRRNYNTYEDDRVMRNAVTYYPDYNGTPAIAAAPGRPAEPMTGNSTDNLFSPRDSPAQQQQRQQQHQPLRNPGDPADSIYQSPSSIITPSKRGDVRRRSPFSPAQAY